MIINDPYFTADTENLAYVVSFVPLCETFSIYDYELK